MAKAILPNNNVNFSFNGNVAVKTDTIEEFIDKHNSLFKEYGAIRYADRFYSETAYLFFKVEQNNIFNFLMCFPEYPKYALFDRYYKTVSKLIDILEKVKNKER